MNITLPSWRTILPNPINPYLILALLLTLVVTYQSCSQKTPSQPSSEPVVATVSKPLVNLQKVEVAIETPTKTIRVYPKSAKGLIKLPKDILGDVNKYVTSSSDVSPSLHRQVITQVIDVGSGETTAYTNTLPYPWLAVESTGSASLDYGYKRDVNTPVARLNVRQDLLQVKALHLGVSASGYSDGDYFVGIGGEYKW